MCRVQYFASSRGYSKHITMVLFIIILREPGILSWENGTNYVHISAAVYLKLKYFIICYST